MTNQSLAEAPAGSHAGGYLCGDVRFATTTKPVRTTTCHCTFCQRLTGSAFLVEPIFRREDVRIVGKPQVYERKSDGSGKSVYVNFCGKCGTTLFLSFQRFPDFVGLCAGTFDDPNWFAPGAGEARHIFTRSAQSGVVLPAGVEIYPGHAIQLDGTPNTPVKLTEPRVVIR